MSRVVYLDDGRISINVTITSTNSEVDYHIKGFLSKNSHNDNNNKKKKNIIGLDTEWTLARLEGVLSERFYNNNTEIMTLRKKKHAEEWTLHGRRSVQEDKSQIAIIVLCDGESCLIFRPAAKERIPRSLFNFLRRSDYTFVGMGIKESVEKLEKQYGVGCKNVVELGPLAAQVMRNPSLSAYGVFDLAFEVASLDIHDVPTSVVFEDWLRSDPFDASILNQKQVLCATLNAYAYFMIGTKLISPTPTTDKKMKIVSSSGVC